MELESSAYALSSFHEDQRGFLEVVVDHFSVEPHILHKE